MVELYEEDIEDWYYHHRKEQPLIKYLCQHIVLKKEDRSICSLSKKIYIQFFYLFQLKGCLWENENDTYRKKTEL